MLVRKNPFSRIIITSRPTERLEKPFNMIHSFEIDDLKEEQLHIGISLYLICELITTKDVLKRMLKIYS